MFSLVSTHAHGSNSHSAKQRSFLELLRDSLPLVRIRGYRWTSQRPPRCGTCMTRSISCLIDSPENANESYLPPRFRTSRPLFLAHQVKLEADHSPLRSASRHNINSPVFASERSQDPCSIRSFGTSQGPPLYSTGSLDDVPGSLNASPATASCDATLASCSTTPAAKTTPKVSLDAVPSINGLLSRQSSDVAVEASRQTSFKQAR